MNKTNITRDFQVWEFTCKCGCGFESISPQLVAKLQLARDIFGESIKVKSGCRCLEHNRKSDSRDDSSHIKGLAADVTCKNPTEFNLIKLAYCLGRAGFKRVGINTKLRFLHADIDNGKPDAIFPY